MLKRYKTEIEPTEDQKAIINRTIGVCRYIYNFYLAHNRETYKTDKKFISAYSFSKWLNNDYIPNNPEYKWIKEVSTKSVMKSILNAEKAFQNFFKGKTRFPKFKKKGKSDVKMYFARDNGKTIRSCERHRIKIPTLGWVKIKEKGYIPTNPKTHVIKSGSVSCKAGRYYVSVLVEQSGVMPPESTNEGLGIDLGVKDFAICSNGTTYKNINKGHKLRKIEKRLKRNQRKLSRKYESLKLRKKLTKNPTQQNIEKQKLKIQKLYQRIGNIRTDYINKVVSDMVKTKPMWITIEDLNVRGMMKNKHLSKAIAQQKFFEFRTKLSAKCHENGIELRIVDRFYPSSKTCHNCGNVKSDLKLSDRTYHCCECGYTTDRDFNASLNLRDAIIYKIA